MHNPGSSELFHYWNRLRAGRPAPDRREIEPVDIRNWLADTFILESGMRNDTTFRLAGTRICAIFGRELKNYSFYSLFSLNDVKLVRSLTQACFKDKAVSVIRFDGISRDNRVQGFEVIFLPLSGANEGARLFGAVFADDKPFWLGADPIVESRVTSVKVLDPDREFTSTSARPSVAIRKTAATTTASAPSPTEILVAGRRFGHLTVISGGLSQTTDG